MDRHDFVSPLGSPEESTFGSTAVQSVHPGSIHSEKEPVEPERGLFTITDEDRERLARNQQYTSPQKSSEYYANYVQQSQSQHKQAVAPEPAFSPIDKEAVYGQHQQAVHGDTGPKRTTSHPRRRLLIIAALVLVVVIALAVGLGVGLGLKKNNSQSGSSTSPSNTTNASLIRDDSSVAAVQSGTGDRFVFFQDGGNNIRWAGYSNSTSQWTATGVLATVIQPKPGSPIAAFVQPGSDLNAQSLIELIYISSNNSVIEIEVAPDKSVQTAIAVDSRALVAAGDAERISVSCSLRPGADEIIDTFFMLRTPSSVGVWQRQDNRSNWSFGDSWYDATSDFTDSTSTSSICEPFSIDTFFGASKTSNSTAPATLARLVTSNCDETSPRILSSVYNSKDGSFTTTSNQVYSFGGNASASGIQGDPAITRSDWIGVQNASEWYFTKDSSLAAFSLQNTALNQSVINASFPYSHLATLKYAMGARSNFVYHQLDDKSFAEHVYDTSLNSWKTTTVDMSTISSSQVSK